MKILRTYKRKGLKGAAHIVEIERTDKSRYPWPDKMRILVENGKGQTATRSKVFIELHELLSNGAPPTHTYPIYIPAYVRALAERAYKDMLLLEKLQGDD